MLDYDIKIKEFKIRNFRLFEKSDIKFEGDHSYSFIGRNATGKTAILEALNICLSDNSSKFNKIKEDDFYSDAPIELEIIFNKPFYLIYPEGTFKRLLPCHSFKKTIKRRTNKSPGELFSSEYQIETAYRLEEYARLSSADYKTKTTEISDFIPSRHYLVWSLEQIDGDYEYTIKSSETKGYVRKHEISFLEKLLFPQVFYFDKDRDRELLTGYNTIFSKIVCELDWRYKVKLAEASKKDTLVDICKRYKEGILDVSNYQDTLLAPAIDILENQLKIDFDVRSLEFLFTNHDKPFRCSSFGHLTKNQRVITADNFGSGISILISLAILIAFAEQSKKTIVVLIDEPELHLHADLQKRLFSFLQNKTFQSFIATHSHLFVDKQTFNNNLILRKDIDGKIEIDTSNQILLANALFDILGNALDDLYIPENLLLVEGRYDRQILTKIMSLTGSSTSMLILACEGADDIPNKGDALESFFEKHIGKSTWYSRFIDDKFRVIVDGDVLATKVTAWETKYTLDSNDIKHLSVNGIEYLYPESLLKRLVTGKTLKDGSNFADKTAQEIVEIVLSDEKLRKKKKDEDIKQKLEELISKQRLNEFVTKEITLDILNSAEGTELLALAEWAKSEEEE